ncbi:MAG: UDP-N-acetylmuramate dehydrogenase, partial [bacterium]
QPTWGSVFKNPPNNSAGKLIESCGLKGTLVGKAQISPMHANFIENIGGATFDDLAGAIHLARSTVKNKHNIDLHLEVRIINPEGELIQI